MGDVIHALPAVGSLKQSFPGSCVAWLVDPKWAPLLEGNPFLDEVIPFDRRNFRELLEIRSRLRARRFELAVDLQGLIKSALLASMAGPARIYGFHQSIVREKLAAVFYSCRVRANSEHVVDQNLELAAAAGASNPYPGFPLPSGRPEGRLPESGFVLASPIGGWRGKQWPLEYYRELAVLLSKKAALTLVVNGPLDSAAELGAIGEVWQHCSGLAGLIDATRRATAVVGIDSGPLHLAAALEKPGVAIFGPTDPARNGPYGESFAVLRGSAAHTTYRRGAEIDPSMREVSPETVCDALLQRLENSSHAAGFTG